MEAATVTARTMNFTKATTMTTTGLLAIAALAVAPTPGPLQPWFDKTWCPRVFTVSTKKWPNEPRQKMSDENTLTIHFNNGTKTEVLFPTQIKNFTAAILEGIKWILESDNLVIQTDPPFGPVKGAHSAT